MLFDISRGKKSCAQTACHGVTQHEGTSFANIVNVNVIERHAV
jgi:hypothetical protein